LFLFFYDSKLTFNAGDVFFCTQRLATLIASNTNCDATSFVFFEISHIDHEVLKEPALKSMWLEYKNASRYVTDENDGVIHSMVTDDMNGNKENKKVGIEVPRRHQDAKNTSNMSSVPGRSLPLKFSPNHGSAGGGGGAKTTASPPQPLPPAEANRLSHLYDHSEAIDSPPVSPSDKIDLNGFETPHESSRVPK
jgi:hypothetical protein